MNDAGTPLVDELGGHNFSSFDVNYGQAGAILSDPSNAAIHLIGGTGSDGSSVFAQGVQDSPSYWSDAASIEYWFRPDADQLRAGTIVNLGSTCDGGGTWDVSLDPSGQVKTTVGYFQGYKYLNSGVVPRRGVWHQMVMTKNVESIEFYLDGVLVSQISSGGWTFYPCASQLTLGIGAAPSAYTAGGDLDEVAYYGRKLTGGDVQAHYRASGRQVPVSSANKAGAPNDAMPCNACTLKQMGLADPVDASTGNFSHTFTDVQVPGRGVPLSFAHTYNSTNAAQPGPIGYGWTSNWMTHLNLGTQAVTLVQERGAEAQFFGSPSGSVGHGRLGRGGQWPPRSRRHRAMRLSVERNP